MKRILISMHPIKENARDKLRRRIFSREEFKDSIEFRDSFNLEDLKKLAQKLKAEIDIDIQEKLKSIKKENKKKEERDKLLNRSKIRIGIDDCEGLK